MKNYNELGNDQQKMDLLILEKSHLRRFREVLIKLSEEITNRDNNIYNLKKYCKELENYKCSIDSRNNEIDIEDKKLFAEEVSAVIGQCQKAVPAKETIPTLFPLNPMIKFDKTDFAFSNLFGFKSCANMLFDASITITIVADFLDIKDVFAPYCGLAKAIIKKKKLITINKDFIKYFFKFILETVYKISLLTNLKISLCFFL